MEKVGACVRSWERVVRLERALRRHLARARGRRRPAPVELGEGAVHGVPGRRDHHVRVTQVRDYEHGEHHHGGGDTRIACVMSGAAQRVALRFLKFWLMKRSPHHDGP